MKNRNKTIRMAVLLFMFTLTSFYAQDVTTLEALSEEVSDNLNLEAVASIFGDSKDLEEFEHKLNDPEAQISNLDLNEDGNVDYLRVVETTDQETHVIVLQSVLGEDLYQDVAAIEVEKDDNGDTRVQVIGDVYIYGPGYIVEPVYVHRPVIFKWFWRPYYRPYRSVFYWGYYPKHFYFWKPFHVHHYKKNVYVHVNVKHTFHYTKTRYSIKASQLYAEVARNDYAIKHPHKAHSVRVVGVNKSSGTKKRVAGVHQKDGDVYRAAGIKKADGTKKRVVGVNKADGTKKRVATKKSPEGSRKSVAVKKSDNGSKKAVAVKKDSRGKKTKKVAAKKTPSKKKVAKRKKK